MKKSYIVTLIGSLLVIGSLIVTLWLDEGLGGRIAQIVTIATAIIGAVALFLQFKKDKEINQASFLMNFSASFYDDYELYDVYNELDKANTDHSYTFDYDAYRIKIVAYLEWIESIASLIEKRIIDFHSIDNNLAYRFFVIVNNKQVQDNELIPFADFYRGTFYLYNKWYKYDIAHGIHMPKEDTALHLAKGYNEVIAKSNKAK